MKIVLLLGPSSAGKSTTCKELQRDGWRVSAFDEVMAPFYDKAKRKCHEAFAASNGLYSELQSIMTEDEVMDLCLSGKLNISKGNHLILNCKLKGGPAYSDLAERLTEAGFSDEEKEVLVPLLKKVGETFLKEFNKLPNHASVLLDDAFRDDAFRSTNPDELVVIDHIPEPNGRAEKFIEGFQERVKAYQQAHGEDSIQSSIILALCTPEELSARVLRRNAEAEAEAEATGNLSSLNNKRVGTFPFDQLAVLLSGDIFHEAQQRVGSVSTEQLRQIAYHHQDHRQLSAAATSGNPASEIVESVLASVFNYSDLSQRFNLASDREIHDLAVRDDFSTFPRINTLSGNPTELAKQIIDIVESEQVSLLKSNSTTFQEFLDKYSAYFSTLDSDERKTHLANAFWKEIDTIKMPVVELADDGSYQVHFLYRKSKEELKDNDLYVQSDFHGCDSALNSQKLNHVGNTDVMCCTTPIKKSEFENALIFYHFIEAPHTYQNKNYKEIEAMSESDRTVDFNNKNNWIADSHRKHSVSLASYEKDSLFCVNEGNDISPWRQAEATKWPKFEDVLLDKRLIHFRHQSDGEIIRIRPKSDGKTIQDSVDLGIDLHSVQILKPAGSVEDVKKIVIVNDGFAYLLSDGVNRLQKMADQEKCAFIFISPGMGLGDPKTNPVSGIRGIEYHHGIDKYNDFVLNKLLPELHKQKIIPENHPTNMTIVGASTSGTAALQTGLTHPDRFSHVIAHSPAPISREIIDSISRAAPLAHFTKDEFITLQQLVFLEQRNSSAGLPELFYKVQSISDFNDNYKNASLTIKEIQLLKEFLHKSDRDDLIEKILKAEKTQKTPIIDLEYGKFEGPTHTRAYDYLGQAYDLLAYGRTLEQQLSIEMQVGMHGHQYEPWMHDLVTRSLPAMFAQQTASVVSERDHVSAAVMPQLGLIAQHTTASQSVVDSAQKSNDANQQPISPKNKQ